MRRLIERVFSDHLETPCHRLTVASLQRTIDAYPARSTAHRTIGYLRPILKWGRVRKITYLDGSLLEFFKKGLTCVVNVYFPRMNWGACSARCVSASTPPMTWRCFCC
jgi:hypothetical protein